MRRTLDTAGCKSISAIGLGCVTFGREIDQKACFEIMDYAQAQGITLFDTAAAYGNGASESIIGAWLDVKGKEAASIIVATKILPPYSPPAIEVSVDQSLARLGTDTVELLYLHQWDASVEEMETLVALDSLVRKGKVRHLGASNFTAQQIQSAISRQLEAGLSPFRFVQNNHNFAVSDITDEFYRVCVHYEIAIVSYSPLGAGFLTGKYGSGLAEDSRFARIPGHQKIYFQEMAAKRLARLQEIAKRTRYDSIQLALIWALYHRPVASVLIGARKKAHIDQAKDALACNVPDILRELEE